jgi:hypothetical protein
MSTSIFITPPEVMTMSLAIKGDGGLICHNFSEKSRRQIAEKQAMGVKAPKNKRENCRGPERYRSGSAAHY